MPKQKVQHLITELHDRFGDDLEGPQQQQLLAQLQNHIHSLDDSETVEPSFIESLDLLVAEVEIEHPHVASILTQIIETLKNIGI